VNHIVNDGLKKLIELYLSVVDLSRVEANSLGQAVIKMEAVGLSGTQLTAQQGQMLMDSIGTVPAKLRKLQWLNISDNSFSEVTSGSLARAVVTIVEVDLSNAELTSDQSQELMDVIRTDKLMRLEVLDLHESDESKNTLNDNLLDVDPVSLGEAMVRVRDVNLDGTELSTDQLLQLMEAIRSTEGRALQHLRLSHPILETVPPDMLAGALVTLEFVALGEWSLTSDQSQHLMEAIRSAKVKKMEILFLGRGMDLRDVDPVCLAEAVVSIQTVDLGLETYVTTEQCLVLANTIIATEERRLEMLYTPSVFRSVVDEEIRERVRQVIGLGEYGI